MGRFLGSLALLGLLAGPAFARGGPLHLFHSQQEQPVACSETHLWIAGS
jgi:hypothetical protein